MENPTQETFEKWHNDPKNWKLGMFYFNREDDRVFLEKRNPLFGITINFANPKSYLAILLMIGFFGFIVYMIDQKSN